MCRIALALLSFLLVATARADCPVANDKLEEALGKAATCAASVAIYNKCLFGSTIDVTTGAVVIKRCEAEFLAKLTKAQKKAYEGATNRCEKKHERQDGTMYRSMAATCRVDVALKHARRFAKVKPK